MIKYIKYTPKVSNFEESVVIFKVRIDPGNQKHDRACFLEGIIIYKNEHKLPNRNPYNLPFNTEITICPNDFWNAEEVTKEEYFIHCI